MTNKEILEKAIQKAIDGGYEGWGWPSSQDLLKWEWDDEDKVFSDGKGCDYESINLEAVIFNHDFAKALWGEASTSDKLWHKIEAPMENGRDYLLHVMPSWQYHLQQMVISDDPIKYLGEHMENELSKKGDK